MQHNFILVIVDRIIESSHFLLVKTTNSEDYARLHILEVVKHHGVPVSIISDRSAQLITQFWKSL